MSKKPDLVIRGGTVIDGSGGPVVDADVAVSDGQIITVGQVREVGTDEIDARGRLVMPGFVDVHTHYDAQVTWANQITPSSCNGVTTVLMGNCGVGFAPVRSDHHDMLISLMEGVEDIPEVVMNAGLPWTWSSFPDYLDTLAARQFGPRRHSVPWLVTRHLRPHLQNPRAEFMPEQLQRRIGLQPAFDILVSQRRNPERQLRLRHTRLHHHRLDQNVIGRTIPQLDLVQPHVAKCVKSPRSHIQSPPR